MKINAIKYTPAQKRKREAELLFELLNQHGYTISDSLSSKDRITILMTTKPNGKRSVGAVPVVKLLVPAESHLGREIAKLRKERNPVTNKSAVTRERARAKKMRPLAKIGAGPR